MIDSENVNGGDKISQSLLRHTPVLTHTLRTLTTEVTHAVDAQAIQKSQLKTFGSCARFLAKLFESSVDEVEEETGVVLKVSPLMPTSDAVPRALGIALRRLALLSVSIHGDEYNESGGEVLDATCRSVNTLFSVMLNLPAPWRDGCLVGGGLRDKDDNNNSVTGAILQLHHSRSLKCSNAANVPVQNRLNCLLTLDSVVLKTSERIACACALAACFDAAREGNNDSLMEEGSRLAGE